MSDNCPPDWFSTWFNSRYYHILYGNRDDAEAQAFVALLNSVLAPLIKNEQPSLLELACGAGRHARMFHSLGYSVTAVDLAAESIAEAKAAGPTEINYQVMDMRHLTFDHSFDVVTNLFTSFGYFEAKSDNAAVLTGVNKYLNSNGLFIIDFLNATRVIQTLVHHEVVTRDNITFEITRHIENDIICKRIRFHADKKTYTFEERVQALQYHDLIALLQAAHLNVIHAFGSYQLEPFHLESSDRVILIAQKL